MNIFQSGLFIIQRSEMDENKAIRLCITHRDPAGFEFLVKKFRREALFHALSFTGNFEDAADACQESFYKAYISITKLTKLERFYPWFYVILRNNCLNLIRKRDQRENGSEIFNNTDIQSPSKKPESFFEEKEENENIWKIVRQLRPEHREILLMKYAMKKNYNDIAINLGIPRGTVMSRLYYARRSFKEKYLGELSHSDPVTLKGGKNGK